MVERDLLLQEKEKMYKEMKDILARQVMRNHEPQRLKSLWFYLAGSATMGN